MTSTIKVNNIQNQCGTAYIERCGTTITLGTSGDNITLACGATQTGFGRTGTVNWDTTAKTASFTAVSGNGYFVNTTSGAITVTLPASPSAGDIVAISDYGRTFSTNNVTVARNGSNIQGTASDGVISTNGQSTTFVYVDGTQGWVPTEDQTTGNYGAQYIVATGGTVTCCGDYKIHTFTGPGTFTVCSVGNPAGSTTVDYLVVAGAGAGGGASGYGCTGAGAGGAGGYRESSGAASGCYTRSPLGACVSALPVTATAYPITVGGGGSVAGNCSTGGNGSNSIFSTITSTGGGGGGGAPSPNNPGNPGGSGGGSSCASGAPNVGAGNTPPVSPPQGNPGGVYPGVSFGSGGGGATSAGGGAPKAGGTGATSSINGTPTGRAGGGGGGGGGPSQPGPAGPFTGGIGVDGGGNGGNPSGGGVPGTANTGGGGGGGPVDDGRGGGNGGSGIVIIRYKYQ